MQIEWLQENANQMVYYKDKIAVCNIICFCQCDKHESIAILLVKPREKTSDQFDNLMFVLPGGKRDFKTFKQSENCWDAMSREFQEEVDDDISNFCKNNCRFFEQTVQVGVDLNMVTNEKLKQSLETHQILSRSNKKGQSLDSKKQYNNTNDQQQSSEPAEYTEIPADISLDQQSSNQMQQIQYSNKKDNIRQLDRRIRSYYIQVNCCDIPDKKFGRFHLYETVERRWFSLESIIYQFRDQFKSDKRNMIIHPKIFRSISIFGGKVVSIQQKQVQKLNYIFNSHKPIEITACQENKQISQTQFFIDRLEKLDTQLFDNDLYINDQESDKNDKFSNNTNISKYNVYQYIYNQVTKINKTQLMFSQINQNIKKQPLIMKIGNDIITL